MKTKILNLSLVLLVVLASCSKNNGENSMLDDKGFFSDESSSGLSSPGESSSGSSQGGSGNQNQPGVITAGEWNDLESWSFWNSTIEKEDFKSFPTYWSFFNNNRISVSVSNTNSLPAVDIPVKLKRDGVTIFSAKTDNKGNAELWIDLFQQNDQVDFSKLTIDINNGTSIISKVKSYQEGINEAEIAAAQAENKIEISFVVDATGSMGDELEYLKTELVDVISRVKSTNSESSILTSAVFYRDEGDDYVTKISNFTKNNTSTIDFIKQQKAAGGGDFPEAVHTALDKAINELQWSTKAKTRLLFLLLDAPPHHNNSVISSIQTTVKTGVEKGIKIIPITASGIDKETEFLMRFLSITTNGTYVFITNHSGIGNEHLEASVGEYQVEYLNDLIVRLINKYAE